MTPLRLYVDEDSMDDDFVKALRVRGVDVHTASDDGMRGRPDRDQLRWSTAQGRVLYSFNVADCYALHADFLLQQQEAPARLLRAGTRASQDWSR